MAKEIKQTPVTVEVRDLKKSYNGKPVLRGISFDVQAGEIFTIMGPSGAGKSVLLKHIIGLETPDSGKILIGGSDAADRETHRKLVTAIVFQDGALFNSMSVYDNLALYPREHRLYDKRTMHTRIMRIMDMLSLKGAENKMPSELSGGMKKRVAVARGLMMEPQLILYDEPTSELDPELGATIAELIGTVRSETGVTTIVVTHDRDLAGAISDHVILLRQGEVAFRGTPQQMKESKDAALQQFLNPTIDLQNPRFRVSGE